MSRPWRDLEVAAQPACWTSSRSSNPGRPCGAGAPQCTRKPSVEKLTSAVSFARNTQRAGELVRLFGRAAGGRVSERLQARLGMPVSGRAILRQLKSHVRKRRWRDGIAIASRTIGWSRAVCASPAARRTPDTSPSAYARATACDAGNPDAVRSPPSCHEPRTRRAHTARRRTDSRAENQRTNRDDRPPRRTRCASPSTARKDQGQPEKNRYPAFPQIKRDPPERSLTRP